MPRRAKSPRRKRSILWRTRNIFLVMLLLFVAAAAGMVSVFWNKVELPEASPVLAETTYICSSEVTGTCTADNSIAQLSGGEDRELVTYEEIPQVLIDAVCSALCSPPEGLAHRHWTGLDWAHVTPVAGRCPGAYE